MHYQWLNDIVFDFVIEILRLVLLLISWPAQLQLLYSSA